MAYNNKTSVVASCVRASIARPAGCSGAAAIPLNYRNTMNSQLLTRSSPGIRIRCAAPPGLEFSFSFPTLHGFADARLQGGLNNFAPAALGFRGAEVVRNNNNFLCLTKGR